MRILDFGLRYVQIHPGRSAIRNEIVACRWSLVYNHIGTCLKSSSPPKAELDLEWFRKNEQQEILDVIEVQLEHQPTVETRNRFQLRPNQTAEWELRIGKFRVFYDVDVQAQIVSIEAVGFKVGNKLFFRGTESEL